MAAHIISNEKKRAISAVEASDKSARKVAVSSTRKAAAAPRVKPFARAAHTMITKLSEEHPDVSSWSESGEMMVITNKEAFVSHLSKFFNTNQFESFSKQLNVYGFKKIGPEWEMLNGTPQLLSRSTPTPGIRHNENFYRFWHPHFHRDGKDRLHQVLPEARPATKSSRKSTRTKTSERVEQEDEDPSEDAELLRARVSFLKKNIADMQRKMEEKVAALELRYKAGVKKLSRDLERACAQRLEEQSKSERAAVSLNTEPPAEAIPNMLSNNPFPSTASIADPRPLFDIEASTLDAPSALFREWSDPLTLEEHYCEALSESPIPEWPPPDSGNNANGRTSIFELSEPFLFREAGLNDCTLTFNFAEI
jgi:hypothetical protein